MQMLYNSDSFAVVQFEMMTAADAGVDATLSRGGYEIVDKFARKEIFIEGALAERFKQDVDALIETSPSEEDIDALVSGYASLAHQPVLMH
jgi:hypothetical protein